MNNVKPLIVVRCKATGVYRITPVAGPGQHGFVTMDINRATRYPDTIAFRERFAHAYPFEVEFISVAPTAH